MPGVHLHPRPGGGAPGRHRLQRHRLPVRGAQPGPPEHHLSGPGADLPLTGTVDPQSGALSLDISLGLKVFVGNCPVCQNGGTAAAGGPGAPASGTCGSGARHGQACTSTDAQGLSNDCLPAGGPVGTLAPTATLATTQASLSAAGCFGDPSCTSIVANASTQSLLPAGTTRAVKLAGAFCIPATGVGVIDGPMFGADLPGPGAGTLSAQVTLNP
jgi:hypothetical protein